MKNIWFLSGLQRSGATLLASILNQNPEMWVSPASSLFHLINSHLSVIENSFENIDYPRNEAILNVVKSTGDLFYADKTAKNIGDKNLNWQTPRGVSVALNISENPKIVCPVRSVVDILASFDTVISATKGNENNAIDDAVERETVPVGGLADRRADYLMRHDKDIHNCLDAMRLALNPQLRHMFHFVEYDDLVSQTEKTIYGIYDFLEIEKYNHEYQNIVDSSSIPQESKVTGIKNLHTVRPKIEKISKNAEDVLSPETIRRYSGLEFWREFKKQD